MNIDWMRCFIEVVKKKSISKASETLNLTQPAVSQQIKKIEDFYGVPLFKRSAFGMELTEAGGILYNRLQCILREFDDLSLELMNFSTHKKITIGTIPSIAMYYLPHKMLKMRSEGIELEVVVRNTSGEVFQLLESDEVNIALIENKDTNKRFWNTEILQESYFAVFPDKHSLSGISELTLRDIENEPLILYPPTCDVRSAITREYQNKGLQPKISIEVAFGESIFGFVLENIGITIVPKIITRHTKHLPLSILPISDFNSKRVISLVSRSKTTGKLISKYLL